MLLYRLKLDRSKLLLRRALRDTEKLHPNNTIVLIVIQNNARLDFFGFNYALFIEAEI